MKRLFLITLVLFFSAGVQGDIEVPHVVNAGMLIGSGAGGGAAETCVVGEISWNSADWNNTNIGSNITKTSNDVLTMTTITENEDSYISIDCGDGNDAFDDNFVIYIDTYATTVTNDFHGGIICWANSLDDMYGWRTSSNDAMCAAWFDNSYRLYLYEFYGASLDQNTYSDRGDGYDYFLRVERSGSTLTMKIYDSAANRIANGATGLYESINLTLNESNAWRYILVPPSYNTGNASFTGTYTISNLEIIAID